MAMTTFLSLGEVGRFGNQCFQIASTIGIAVKNGQKYAFPKWMNIDHMMLFDSDENIKVYEYFVNPLPEINNFTFIQNNIKWGRDNFIHKKIDWGYHDIYLLKHRNYDLWGHMQSEKYFKHCERRIRHYFELKEPKKKLNIPAGSVCVHVRRGDYELKNDYHPVMTKEYYEKAFALLPEHGNVYVFSDEPEKVDVGSMDITVVSGYDYMTDFYNMVQCDHFIISNSTFSWWAAWLSKNKNKTVIMPKTWFGPAASISEKDLVCEGWITI